MNRKLASLLILALFTIGVVEAYTIPSATYHNNKQLKPYITHEVKKGESISSILKRYQMPLSDFLESNKAVKDRGDVVLGEKLSIPRNSIGSSNNASINRDIKEFIKQKGNIKVADTPKEVKAIEAPITEKLDSVKKEVKKPLYQEIKLQKLPEDTKKFDYHTVLPRETLYGISKLYNVKIDDILKYNLDVKEDGLKEHSTIRIPRFGALIEEPVAEKKISIKDMPVEVTPFEVFDNSEEKDRVNIAILMPVLGESDPREDGFIDLYRGFLLASDSLKKAGLSSRVDFYGIGRGTDLLYNLISENKLADADMIVGPVFEEQFAMAAAYAQTERIPIISPLLSTKVNNQYVVEIAPKKSTYLDKTEGFFDDKKLIVYKSSNDDNEFLNDVIKHNDCKIDETIRYNKFISPDSLATFLDKDRENVFIVTAKDNLNIELLLSKLVAVKATAYNKKMSVFASSHVSNISKEKRGDFFRTDINYITSSFQDRTNEASAKFEQSYFDMFQKAPTPFSYRGYEIGIMFMEQYLESGKNMLNDMNDVMKQVIQVPYLFYRDNNNTKLVNEEWLFVNYKSDYSIIIK